MPNGAQSLGMSRGHYEPHGIYPQDHVRFYRRDGYCEGIHPSAHVQSPSHIPRQGDNHLYNEEVQNVGNSGANGMGAGHGEMYRYVALTNTYGPGHSNHHHRMEWPAGATCSPAGADTMPNGTDPGKRENFNAPSTVFKTDAKVAISTSQGSGNHDNKGAMRNFPAGDKRDGEVPSMRQSGESGVDKLDVSNTKLCVTDDATPRNQQANKRRLSPNLTKNRDEHSGARPHNVSRENGFCNGSRSLKKRKVSWKHRNGSVQVAHRHNGKSVYGSNAIEDRHIFDGEENLLRFCDENNDGFVDDNDEKNESDSCEDDCGKQGAGPRRVCEDDRCDGNLGHK